MTKAAEQDKPDNLPKKPERRTARIILYSIAAILALIVLIFLWNLTAIKAYTDVGTGYAARVVCSCRYIGDRTLDDCEKDFEPGMETVSLADDETAKRITASVPFLAEDQAEFREGFGCVLLTDEERAALKE